MVIIIRNSIPNNKINTLHSSHVHYTLHDIINDPKATLFSILSLVLFWMFSVVEMVVSVGLETGGAVRLERSR